MFIMEIFYNIKEPSFIEFVAEFDIAFQNIELFVFRSFADEDILGDQELAESSFDIPSAIESKALRHTSIYLTTPGRYSVFVVDKKLPKFMRLMNDFEDENPCAILKISHSIQQVSINKLIESSLLFLSVWPRRIDINDPFMVRPDRNFMVTVYPNSLNLDAQEPPKVKFSVLNVDTSEKMYTIEPDRTTVIFPSRSLQTSSKAKKFIKEVEIN